MPCPWQELGIEEPVSISSSAIEPLIPLKSFKNLHEAEFPLSPSYENLTVCEVTNAPRNRPCYWAELDKLDRCKVKQNTAWDHKRIFLDFFFYYCFAFPCFDRPYPLLYSSCEARQYTFFYYDSSLFLSSFGHLCQLLQRSFTCWSLSSCITAWAT